MLGLEGSLAAISTADATLPLADRTVGALELHVTQLQECWWSASTSPLVRGVATSNKQFSSKAHPSFPPRENWQGDMLPAP